MLADFAIVFIRKSRYESEYYGYKTESEYCAENVPEIRGFKFFQLIRSFLWNIEYLIIG